MKDIPKPEPSSAEEAEPLSATAIFFRSLENPQQPGQAEAPVALEAGHAQLGAGSVSASAAGSEPGAARGEFTAIFGSSGSSHGTPDSSNPAAASAADFPTGDSQAVAQSAWQDVSASGKQAPGEFTRIFVKGSAVPTRPATRKAEMPTEAGGSNVPRARGFSSPGGSDAASTDTSFTNVFKLGAKEPEAVAAQSQAARQIRIDAARTERLPSTETSFASSGSGVPASANAESQSVTRLIESLSTPTGRSEPAPYEAEPLPSYKPVPPKAPLEFESGGVTQFIQKLSDLPPAPTPSPAPVWEASAGPGEYTRIIAAPNQTANPISPSAVPSASAPSQSAPAVAFVCPAVPATPPTPAVPHQMSAAPQAVAAPGAPVVAPTPHFPPVPTSTPVAAPKGKLEGLVPILLVVNTFLLVMILVVMIFLIMGR